MPKHLEDLDVDAEERLAFWLEFLNTEEGRLIAGELGEDEMKHFQADGFLYELRSGDEGRIQVKLVKRD